jgi:general secretion pathway protein J
MNQRGFTLLELLIGLALTGFILTLLFAAFRLGAQSWDAIDARSERIAQAQVSRSVVTRLIGSALPFRWKRGASPTLAFAGNDTELQFVAFLPQQLQQGGLARIALRIEPGAADTTRLTLRYAPLTYLEQDFAGLDSQKPFVLMEVHGPLRFAYFGSPSPTEPPAWQGAWQAPDALPTLVRLGIDDATEPAPDLVAALAITGSGCLWDSFYEKCVN